MNSQVKILRLNLEEAFIHDQMKVNEVLAVAKRIIDGKKPVNNLLSPLFFEQSRRSIGNKSKIAEGMRSLLKYSTLCWLSNKEVLGLLNPLKYLSDSFLIEKLNDENRRLKQYYENHRELFSAYSERVRQKVRGFAACQKHSEVLLPNPKMYSLLTSEETRALHTVNNRILMYCDQLKRESLPVPSFRGFCMEELIEIDIWESKLLASPRNAKSAGKAGPKGATGQQTTGAWSSLQCSGLSNSDWQGY